MYDSPLTKMCSAVRNRFNKFYGRAKHNLRIEYDKNISDNCQNVAQKIIEENWLVTEKGFLLNGYQEDLKTRIAKLQSFDKTNKIFYIQYENKTIDKAFRMWGKYILESVANQYLKQNKN